MSVWKAPGHGTPCASRRPRDLHDVFTLLLNNFFFSIQKELDTDHTRPCIFLFFLFSFVSYLACDNTSLRLEKEKRKEGSLFFVASEKERRRKKKQSRARLFFLFFFALKLYYSRQEKTWPRLRCCDDYDDDSSVNAVRCTNFFF